jgi:hypothetical protein
VKDEDAYACALRDAARDEDGTVDAKVLAENLADLIDFNGEQERLNKARRIIERHKRPGGSPAVGQLAIPGLEPYAWEPARLIVDEQGRAIEQARAKPRHKHAEAARAHQNAGRAAAYAVRKTLEADEFAAWHNAQLARGRAERELTMQAFVMEAGIWREGQAQPDDEPAS